MIHAKENPRKVEMKLNRVGAPIIVMIEKTPDGNLFYYMTKDGAWQMYDPATDVVEPFTNARFQQTA